MRTYMNVGLGDRTGSRCGSSTSRMGNKHEDVWSLLFYIGGQRIYFCRPLLTQRPVKYNNEKVNSVEKESELTNVRVTSLNFSFKKTLLVSQYRAAQFEYSSITCLYEKKYLGQRYTGHTRRSLGYKELCSTTICTRYLPNIYG